MGPCHFCSDPQTTMKVLSVTFPHGLFTFWYLVNYNDKEDESCARPHLSNLLFQFWGVNHHNDENESCVRHVPFPIAALLTVNN
jgi:hypothetical protein